MTGSEFVKKLKPIGCAFFLFLFAVFMFICFSSGVDPIKDYEPPHDSAYYAQNQETMQELCDELNENVCPKLEGITSCVLSENKIVISIEDKKYVHARADVLQYFDEELFTFVRDTSAVNNTETVGEG